MTPRYTKRAKSKAPKEVRRSASARKTVKRERPERRTPHDPKVNGLTAKKPSSRPRPAIAGKQVESLELQSRYKTIAFVAKPASELAERKWRSQAARLLADMKEYQHEARGLVPGVFYDKVLEDFRRWRTGLTAIKLGGVLGPVSHAPVPSELSLVGGGWLVSGGLPTLGRRR